MSSYAQWQEANNSYLAAALSDLRERLQRLADADAVASAQNDLAANPPSVKRISWFRRFVPGVQSPLRETRIGGLLTNSPPAEQSDMAPAEPTSESDAPAAAESDVPALTLLAQRLAMSDFERELLLLCAAIEFDTRIGALCARAQHDPSKPYPTFGLAMALFEDAAWDAMSPERPLRYWRLIEIHQPPTQSLIGSALKADERIVNYLKGANYLDDRIAPLFELLPPGEHELPPSQQRVAAEVTDQLRVAARSGALPIVHLLGSDRASKLQVAQSVAATLNLSLYRLNAEAIPAALADQETLVRLWQRETVLRNLALYVQADDIDRASTQGAQTQRLLSRLGGVCLVSVREPWPGFAREVIPADVAKPTSAEQRAAWAEALGGQAAELAQRPATHFSFDAATIRHIAANSLAAGKDDPGNVARALWTYSLNRARPMLDQLAQRIDVKASWNDLQLPASEKALLRQIVDQAEHRGTVYDDWGFRERMNRGLGISVLFAGPSGTGKTMAAEIIARELDLPLYRVDLSTVVNKYIGETEKNLRRLFDAAEDSGAILHCDEADALFGKRSEVKDSHDRYANIEINYLLQRIEAFHGLAILTTNMKNALDSAFLRRLRFIVNFPFPGAAERESIWRGAFPLQAAIGALDFGQLARFSLTGGSIQNIALNAAFLAAREGAQITMPRILEAARTEFRKLDKPVNEADFRRLESVASGP
ncbi:MAG TPA: AAA family ATPase [Rudaea sp.]|nr:AAA family ATPase [Rudaea sp.]